MTFKITLAPPVTLRTVSDICCTYQDIRHDSRETGEVPAAEIILDKSSLTIIENHHIIYKSDTLQFYLQTYRALCLRYGELLGEN